MMNHFNLFSRKIFSDVFVKINKVLFGIPMLIYVCMY
jgi:hypothetical protein